MVNALAGCLMALIALGHSPVASPPQTSDKDPTHAVSSALSKGKYPWYNPEKDAVKTITPPRVRRAPAASGWLGNMIATLLFLIALAILIGVLLWFWKIFEPSDAMELEKSKNRGEPSRVEALPPGMRREFESSDPWEEALRRRARGDLAGAMVCLFAHQLLTLSRLGLVRLAPGRTGRQLLRAVTDAEFQALVYPTLRQFEAVYYGHRIPSAEEFAVVWASAEGFERRVAEGVVA